MKRVAVVILNWNGKDFLKKFLPSVLRSCVEVSNNDIEVAEIARNSVVSDDTPVNSHLFSVDANVIVADNGSSDSSADTFKEIAEDYFSSSGSGAKTIRAQWIQLDKNYGFTGGYNRAVRELQHYDYDYYILLNSDIYTPDGWLFPLISFMEQNLQVGVCQPKVLAYNGSRYDGVPNVSDTFEYAGASGGFIDKYGFPFCRGRILSEIEKDMGQYDIPLRTFWATGACMVVRSSVWKQLGGLDEDFFAHMEEIDFCWRAALLGHQIWVVPQSSVYHVGGGTLPNNSPQKLFYNYRNNLLMLKKNLPASKAAEKIFIRKIIDWLSAVAYCFKFKFSFAGAVYRAHRDYNRMKRKLAPSPRCSNRDGSTSTTEPYGIYPHSIIFSFFTGKRTFAKLK